MPSFERKKNGWLATVKYRGQRHRKQLRTRSQADQWARKTLDRLRLGESAEPPSITVSEAVDRYMASIAPLQAISGHTRRVSNARLVSRLVGKYRVADLTADLLIDEYVQPRLQKVSPDTVRRELSLISQVLFSQSPNVQTSQTVVSSVRRRLFQQRRLASPARRDRRLSSVELKSLLRACTIPLRYIVWLTVQTGLRRGEFSSISIGANSITVTGKTGRRNVPLSRSAQKIIGKVHPVPYAPRTISKYFKEACDKAGIDDYHFHDLRAEAAHRMLEGRIYKRKCTIDEVAQILGNSVRVLEKHYANHYRFDGLN